METELISMNETDERLFDSFSPMIEEVFDNPYRAGILFLLKNSKFTNFSMKVNRLAFHLGCYERNVIYHLEQLNKVGLVIVRRYTERKVLGMKITHRDIWGLNIKLINWIDYCYKYCVGKYGIDKLKEISYKNKNVKYLRKKHIL